MKKEKLNKEKLRYLFLIFVAGSIIGWVYEVIYVFAVSGDLQNRGVLYGPWLPIYGVGASGLTMLKSLRKKPCVLFPVCLFVAGFTEYIIGFISISVFGLRLWDYSDMFLNLDGIICFMSVVAFAVMGMFFLCFIEPKAESLFHRMPSKTTEKLSVIILIVMLADIILSILFRTPITY